MTKDFAAGIIIGLLVGAATGIIAIMAVQSMIKTEEPIEESKIDKSHSIPSNSN